MRITVLLIALMMVACAHKPTPFEPISKAKEMLAQANIKKAAERAPVEMHLAQEKLLHAEDAYFNFDHRAAGFRAKEAETLAELAITKSRLEVSKTEVARLERDVFNFKPVEKAGVIGLPAEPQPAYPQSSGPHSISRVKNLTPKK